jgi:hypothetical protein
MEKIETQSQNSAPSAEEHDVTKMTPTQLKAKVEDLQEQLTAAKINMGALGAEVTMLLNKINKGMTDEALAKKGVFPRGSLLTLGLGQDTVNMFNDPTVAGKVYHGVSGITKVVGVATVASATYGLIAGWLAKRAALKAASHMAGIEAGNSLETAAMATAAVF